MEFLLDPEVWIALATLTALELVLGVDNIVFITILAGRLPEAQRDRARRLGLLGAMGTRVLLLLALAWIVGLTAPLFSLLGEEISGRDLILILGGLFLLAKATWEIHHKLEDADPRDVARPPAPSFGSVIAQIMLLDIVFSLDSVITAVGMVREVWIMVTAVVIAIGAMLWFARPIGDFVDRHPTVKMLALSFLLLIGMALVADGLEMHIPKGYIYFAMGFSVLVEMLNLRVRTMRRRSSSGTPS